MAIMMVPMMMVQTICEDEKYGANSLLAPSSTAITLIPAKNSVRYRYALFFRIFLFMLYPLVYFLELLKYIIALSFIQDCPSSYIILYI